MNSTKIAIIEKEISNVALDLEPRTLYAPIRYIMEDGGKRMRPILTILACEVFGKPTQEVYQAAIALEVFHNFTLLHDDIMDNAPLRRGRDTVHVKWNPNVAILSGDAMLILAYRLLSEGVAPDKLSRVIEIFNKAAMEVCEGQQYDMNFETSEHVSLDEYLNMIRLKTAVLMAAALEIGAYIAGANQDQAKSLYMFGVNLGLAFQIQDDILDTYGDQSLFGKAIGGDIAVGKKTFLYITAFEKADTNQRQILTNSRDLEQVREVYDQLGVREKSEESVVEYFEKAMDCLTQANPDLSRTKSLREYAEMLLKRDK